MSLLVRAAGLTKTFENGGHARTPLRDLDLEVGEGELCAIMGESGSGKSTLLTILGGLDTRFEGSLELFGADVRTLSDRELSRLRGSRIGFVFQNYQLLVHRTVIENVLLPTTFSDDSPRGLEDRARSLLELLGLGGREDEPTSSLSGGQRQRVAIARALIQHPSLLLCDEPTGNLDAETASRVVGVLSAWRSEATGRAVVTVTHARELVAAATQRLRLADGQLQPLDREAQP